MPKDRTAAERLKRFRDRRKVGPAGPKKRLTDMYVYAAVETEAKAAVELVNQRYEAKHQP